MGVGKNFVVVANILLILAILGAQKLNRNVSSNKGSYNEVTSN